MQDSIQRDKNPRRRNGEQRDQIGDIAQTVTGVMTCAKTGPSARYRRHLRHANRFKEQLQASRTDLTIEIVRLLAH